MGNLGSVGLGMEQEQVEVVGVGDKEGLVAGGAQVTGLLVGTVANLGHGNGASETTTHAGVDTLGLAPRLANTVVAVRVVTLELLVAVLLDDLGVGEGGGHLLFVSPRAQGNRDCQENAGIINDMATTKLEDFIVALRVSQ